MRGDRVSGGSIPKQSCTEDRVGAGLRKTEIWEVLGGWAPDPSEIPPSPAVMEQGVRGRRGREGVLGRAGCGFWPWA